MSWAFDKYSSTSGALVHYDKVSRPIPQDDWWKDTKQPKAQAKFLNEILGTVGTPGPFLPVDLRPFNLATKRADMMMSRTRSAQSLGTGYGLGTRDSQANPKMYSATKVPTMNGDWMNRETHEQRMRSRSASALK